MRLTPGQLVFGVAPEILVDCAQQIHSARWDYDQREVSIDDFSKALGAPKSEALPVLDAMMKAGFITKAAGRGEICVPTKKLGQLALAKISSGISRGEADALLARVIRKAECINRDAGEDGPTVECIVVFGSYLSDVQVLGDLDIGVEVAGQRRYDPERDGGPREWHSRRVSAALSTFRALRLRQPRKISVHQLEEVVGLGTRYELVFGRLPDR